MSPARLRARAIAIDSDFERLQRRAEAIFHLRSGAASFRRLAKSWREVAELTRAELCTLRAEKLDTEAERLETGGAK